jgi:hypothetical protein
MMYQRKNSTKESVSMYYGKVIGKKFQRLATAKSILSFTYDQLKFSI